MLIYSRLKKVQSLRLKPCYHHTNVYVFDLFLVKKKNTLACLIIDDNDLFFRVTKLFKNSSVNDLDFWNGLTFTM